MSALLINNTASAPTSNPSSLSDVQGDCRYNLFASFQFHENLGIHRSGLNRDNAAKSWLLALVFNHQTLQQQDRIGIVGDTAIELLKKLADAAVPDG